MNGRRQTVFLLPLVFVLVAHAGAPGGMPRFPKKPANDFLRVPPTTIVLPTYVITLYEGDGIDTSRGEHLAGKFKTYLQNVLPPTRVKLWATEDIDYVTNCKEVRNCEILGIYEERHIEDTGGSGFPEIVREYEYAFKHKLPAGEPEDHRKIKFSPTCNAHVLKLTEEECRESAFEVLATLIQGHDIVHHIVGQ